MPTEKQIIRAQELGQYLSDKDFVAENSHNEWNADEVEAARERISEYQTKRFFRGLVNYLVKPAAFLGGAALILKSCFGGNKDDITAKVQDKNIEPIAVMFESQQDDLTDAYVVVTQTDVKNAQKLNM